MASAPALPAVGEANILYCTFNQTYDCFTVGTENGFIVFNTNPLSERFRRDFGKGIGIVEPLYKSNILALVGGGRNPIADDKKVVIWDDYQNKPIAEIEFSTSVKAVKLRKDKILVALEDQIFIYNFSDLSIWKSKKTEKNSNGCCAMSTDEHSPTTVIAHPHEEYGKIVIWIGEHEIPVITQMEDKSSITKVAVSQNGNYVAAANHDGRRIYIWEVNHERREVTLKGYYNRSLINPAHNLDIAFHPSLPCLILSSEKKTAHLVQFGSDIRKKVVLRNLRESTRCAFFQDSIIIISTDGHYLLFKDEKDLAESKQYLRI